LEDWSRSAEGAGEPYAARIASRRTRSRRSPLSASGGHQVDVGAELAAEEVANANEVEEPHGTVEVDEQVDVARVGRLAAGDGPEDEERADAELGQPRPQRP
jgi:hypothetical protein